MKRAVTAFLLSCAIAAHAAGPLEGVFQCAVSGPLPTQTSYIAVNGHADGAAVFTVVGLTHEQAFFGYGIGRVSGIFFAGNTEEGAPFNFIVDSQGFSGTISVKWNGSFTNMAASCARIW